MSDEPTARGWRRRQALTGTELPEFLALLRLCRHQCGIIKVGQHYVQDERPLLPFVATALTGLIETGHATLTEPDHDPHEHVVVTATGRVRYKQLCEQQGINACPGTVPSDGVPGQ